jgi:hypothetical protein
MRRIAALLVLLFASTAALAVDFPVRLYRFTEPGWTLSGPTQITGAYGYHSIPVSLVLSGYKAPYAASIASSKLFPSQMNHAYEVVAWVNGDKAFYDTMLGFFVSSGPFEVFGAVVMKADVAPGWQRVDLGTLYNSSFSPDSLYFGAWAWNYAYAPDNRWLVGSIEFDEIGGDDAPAE